MDDYYKILGVSYDANSEQIKLAYRKLIKEYHPDRIRNTALKDYGINKSQLINEAYDTLSNPDKKRKYDETYDYHSWISTPWWSNNPSHGSTFSTPEWSNNPSRFRRLKTNISIVVSILLPFIILAIIGIGQSYIESQFHNDATHDLIKPRSEVNIVPSKNTNLINNSNSHVPSSLYPYSLINSSTHLSTIRSVTTSNQGIPGISSSKPDGIFKDVEISNQLKKGFSFCQTITMSSFCHELLNKDPSFDITKNEFVKYKDIKKILEKHAYADLK